MNGRVNLQGMLAQKGLEHTKLTIQAQGLVRAIYTQCTPFESLIKLPVEEIASQAKDLNRLVHKIRKLEKEIKDLQEELGIEDDG